MTALAIGHVSGLSEACPSALMCQNSFLRQAKLTLSDCETLVVKLKIFLLLLFSGYSYELPPWAILYQLCHLDFESISLSSSLILSNCIRLNEKYP